MIKELYKSILPEAFRNQVRILINKVKYPFYIGNNFECNCCGKSFRRMLPKGDRSNAECPYCGALERTRLLLHYLERTDTFVQAKDDTSKPKQKVLHFAPEPSLFKRFSQLEMEYIDADINPANASHVVDITNIGYEDDYFDYIICSHVIAHVPNEDKAITELHRVLSPEGRAIVMTYINPDSFETIDHEWINTPELRKQHYGEPDCLRLHGGDFAKRLANGGFKVNQIDYRNQLGDKLIHKNVLGEGPREWIFECRKS